MPETLSVNTVDELLALAKFWTQEALDMQFSEFLTATSLVEERSYAWHQVDCIGGLLGDEVVNKAVEEAAEVFGKTRDPRAWGIFMRGDPEEWRTFQDEVQRKLDKQNTERADGPSA